MVCFLVLVTTVPTAMTVTLKDIDEIQALLNVYKETLREETNSKEILPREENIIKAPTTTKYITPKDSKRCARNTRKFYKECLKRSSNKTLERRSSTITIVSGCAQQYSYDYPRCFFGDFPSHGDESCSKVCLIYMDTCLIESNKLEQVLCMNARDKCLVICEGDGDGGSTLTEPTTVKKQSPTMPSTPAAPETTSKLSLLTKRKMKLQLCHTKCSQHEADCKQLTNNDQVCFFASIECRRTCRLTYLIRKTK